METLRRQSGEFSVTWFGDASRWPYCLLGSDHVARLTLSGLATTPVLLVSIITAHSWQVWCGGHDSQVCGQYVPANRGEGVLKRKRERRNEKCWSWTGQWASEQDSERLNRTVGVCTGQWASVQDSGRLYRTVGACTGQWASVKDSGRLYRTVGVCTGQWASEQDSGRLNRTVGVCTGQWASEQDSGRLNRTVGIWTFMKRTVDFWTIIGCTIPACSTCSQTFYLAHLDPSIWDQCIVWKCRQPNSP